MAASLGAVPESDQMQQGGPGAAKSMKYMSRMSDTHFDFGTDDMISSGTLPSSSLHDELSFSSPPSQSSSPRPFLPSQPISPGDRRVDSTSRQGFDQEASDLHHHNESLDMSFGSATVDLDGSPTEERLGETKETSTHAPGRGPPFEEDDPIRSRRELEAIRELLQITTAERDEALETAVEVSELKTARAQERLDKREELRWTALASYAVMIESARAESRNILGDLAALRLAASSLVIICA